MDCYAATKFSMVVEQRCDRLHACAKLADNRYVRIIMMPANYLCPPHV